MKRSTALLAASVLLITGCGASDEPAEPAAQAEESPSQTPTTAPASTRNTVPVEDTCEGLFGDRYDNLHLRSSTFLQEVTEFSDESIAESQELSEPLYELMETAEGELEGHIQRMWIEIDNFWVKGQSGGEWVLDSESYTQGAQGAIDVCSPILDVEAAPEKSVTQQAELATGDYAADLEALGVVVDDVDQYRAFVSERVCESDLNSRLTGFMHGVRLTRGGGDNDDALRLTAAYDCPERLEPLEEMFIELDAEG